MNIFQNNNNVRSGIFIEYVYMKIFEMYIPDKGVGVENSFDIDG